MVVRGAYDKILKSLSDQTEVEQRSTATDYGQVGTNALQRNKSADKHTGHYTIVWHYLDNISPDSEQAAEIQETEGRGRNTLDGRVLRSLEVGDSVSVWGRTRFGQWMNFVEEATVRVYWAI